MSHPTSRITITPASPEGVALAARRLREGGLAALPTETVYGLGANALDEGAVARIFRAKGRPATNPLIVHVADANGAMQAVREWPGFAQRLAEAFWPGPLTLVLPRRDNVPQAVTAGLDSVGVRVPAHPLALELLREAGIPIAAPSANRSEELSPTRAEHVLASLGPFLDAERDVILDGGPCRVGIESSVLDLTQSPPVLLRPGGLARAAIEEAIGPIRVLAPPSSTSGAPHDAPRPSPGMAARHYAPRARALRFESREALQKALQNPPRRLGLVALELLGTVPAEVRVMPASPEGYASRLYEVLHELDEARCEEIWIEMPPESEEWRAVRDRLARATVEGG